MDITTIIVVSLALAAFFIPVLYYEIFKKGAARKFENEFLELGKKEGLSLADHDIWRNRYAIGVDRKKRKLLYLNRKGDGNETLTVDLARVANSRLSREENRNGAPSGYRIEIHLSSPEFEGGSRRIEFFDSEGKKTELNESVLADKWLRIIRERR